MAGGLFLSMGGAAKVGRRVCRRKGKLVYQISVGDEERRKDLKWLTCWVFFVVWRS